MTKNNHLHDMLVSKKARVGIIGFGYVGLPLAVELVKNGFKVTGFEVDKSKVKQISSKKSYIDDISSGVIATFVKNKTLKATTDFSELKNQDVIVICVPTPLRKSKDPDVSYILDAVVEIKSRLKKNQLVILESTTYPGTTHELVLPQLEETGLKAGKDFFLAFSPERIDPGNKKFGLKNTPKVVGGISAKCGKLAEEFYSNVADRVVRVSNAQSAEMVKLIENTFRAVNIGMVNEIALMCDRLKLDVWEILNAAASKPFGYMPFYPGPGIGGHCIPLDPHYLGWKMKTLNFEPRFIELAGSINSSMPGYVVNRLSRLLDKAGKCLSKSKILVIGVSYKQDISDHRESPAVDVMALLSTRVKQVAYHDPYVKKMNIEGKILSSRPITKAEVSKYDCVVIITPHSKIDYKQLSANAKMIFDTRNATQGIKNKKIFKL
jgi:UDP-N-acetyl-D-glucosamine dehydrogenase